MYERAEVECAAERGRSPDSTVATVEDLVDVAGELRARGLDQRDGLALRLGEGTATHQVAVPGDRVEGRAELVARGGQETRARAVGLGGPGQRRRERAVLRVPQGEGALHLQRDVADFVLAPDGGCDLHRGLTGEAPACLQSSTWRAARRQSHPPSGTPSASRPAGSRWARRLARERRAARRAAHDPESSVSRDDDAE